VPDRESSGAKRRWYRSQLWRGVALAIALASAIVNGAAAGLLFVHGNPMGVLNVGCVLMAPVLYRVATS
jgi:hypothetical protein